MTKKPAPSKPKKAPPKKAAKKPAAGTDATLSVLDGTSKNLIRAAFLKRNH